MYFCIWQQCKRWLPCSITPDARRLLAESVTLSTDLLSEMMTTALGTLGLRPAEGFRRYSSVKANAWPTERDSQSCVSSTHIMCCEITGKPDQCCFQGFHQMAWTGSLEAAFQICYDDWAETMFWVESHIPQLQPERKREKKSFNDMYCCRNL